MPDDSSDESLPRSRQVAFDVNLRISPLKFSFLGSGQAFLWLPALLHTWFSPLQRADNAAHFSSQLSLVPVESNRYSSPRNRYGRI